MRHLAPQAAAAILTTRWHERRDRSRAEQLEMLTERLAGGTDFEELLKRVVQSIADVLEAQEASLYLLDESDKRLKIRAACGKHQALLNIGAWYNIGEGVTGYIATSDQIIKASGLAELKKIPGYKAKYVATIGGCEPNAFLGIPLIVHLGSLEPRMIGVLKLEDRPQSPNRPTVFFNDEDVRLAEMVARVLATVVYNAQVGDAQIQNISTNIGELSKALGGGKEMDTLVKEVVKTIAQILSAEASSLYLIDEKDRLLKIKAATGYQETLVEKQASYTLGEGITGWIADKGEVVRARSRKELMQHPNWKGKLDPDQGGRQPNSFLGLPLKVVDRFSGKEKVIGVLKVEDIKKTVEQPEPYFTDQDVKLVEMMANVIATVVYNTQVGDAQIQNISTNIGELSKALGGGKEMDTLVKEVVKTIAQILSAEASSLYLIDEKDRLLKIKAATGYQETLVEKQASYTLGEGITGWIADKGEVVRARSRKELMQHPNWKGKLDPDQGGRQPNSFLGLPLKVVDRFSGKEKVIGVLKVEDIIRTEKHPEKYFTDQDVRLVEMMANVIATVVYNTQVGDAQLRHLSSNLRELSNALARGQEMKTLVENVVDTIARVLHAEASSLYLIDNATGRLVIQAATGYQKPLVEKKASYRVGDGITGWIADKKGQDFRANSRKELMAHPNWKGRQDKDQQGRQPNSFLGLPLKVVDSQSGDERVTGVLKVEDIRPSGDHPEEWFTDQDQLLVTMMANVIATVIQNTRVGEQRSGKTLGQLGLLSAPVNATPILLRDAARSADLGVLDQLAVAISTALSQKPELIESEAHALFTAGANPTIYGRIASWASGETVGGETVRWEFSLLNSILSASGDLSQWERITQIAEPWRLLKRNAGQPAEFADAARELAPILAHAVQAEILSGANDPSGVWCGTVLDTQRIFGSQQTLEQLPLLLQRQGELDDDNVDRLVNFIQRGFQRSYSVALLIPWDFDTSQEQIEAMKARARLHAVDVVVASPEQMLQILASPRAPEEFRSLVLRQATYAPPFVIVGSVPDAMFFGRNRELSEIVQYLGAGRSSAVIGGRRIGKSSILERLHRVRLPEAGFRTVLCDAATIPTYGEFLAAPLRDWRPDSPPGTPTTVSRLLDASPTDKPIVLLLDEADKVVKGDKADGWRIFNQLRALSSSGRAQVVLSGERVLGAALQDPGSPLFNFVNELLLGPLSLPDVEALVTSPIKQLDIDLVDEVAIVRQVFDFTSGHPNVVQRLCRRLILRLNEQNRRQITLKDVTEVIESAEFIYDDFLPTYFQKATALERLCALFMAQEDGLRTATAVRGALVRENMPATLTEVRGSPWSGW